MPQYDESFILDDNINQRRNKRSYRVSRKGLLPCNGTPSTIDGHGTYVLRNNINNLKNKNFGSNHALKENGYASNGLYAKSTNKSFPSLLDDPRKRNPDDRFIISAADPRDVFSIKNNNYYSFSPGKSLEDLASDGHYPPSKKTNGIFFGHSRGKSLQNLNEGLRVPFFGRSNPAKSHMSRSKSKDSSIDCNHYIVNESANDKRAKRLYESNAKLKEKAAIRLATRILESGVYRQIGKAKCDENDDSGFADDGFDDAVVGGSTPTNVNSSGHKASFRSANKLARRARSFKEDILERISAMRSPGVPSNHTALPSLRSQSPLSPKGRSQSKTDDSESNPAKELEILVKQIRFDLKHFSDVITKKILVMLPGNGTIILDTITNIHNVIQPYISNLADSPSEALSAAHVRLCNAVADLIKLCDESMILGEDCKALNVANVQQITTEVQNAVENLATIAFEKMSGGNAITAKANGAVEKDLKSLKLQIRPSLAVDGIRNNTNDGQRNSLPDIPLTPHERQILEGSGNGISIRTSHSTESILDSVVTTPHQEPPPKPPIPNRTFDIAPPLPPKRRTNDNSFSHLSTVDRVSLQSHSTGSLDSMQNVSNDEEIRAIMDRNSINLDDSLQNTSLDEKGLSVFPPCLNNRLSQDSNSTIATISSTATSGPNRLSNEINAQQIQINDSFQNEIIGNQCTNHNRFSAESGFVSMRNTRGSEMSFSNINCTNQNQKYNLTYIDSTPTPGDMPVSLLGDLSLDLNSKFSSSSNINISQLSNVVQQSSVKQILTSNQFFEQNSKTVSSNESKFFSQTSLSSNAFELQKSTALKTHHCLESSSFVKSQKNISQVTTLDGNNISSLNCSTANFSSQSNANIINLSTESDINTSDVTDCAIPPILPVKTRKPMKTNMHSANSVDQGFSALDTSFDDQVVELRERTPSCAVHGQPDGLIHRPHTLMGQIYSFGQPPPLPIKKKHMFQSVAYSVMAYMEMFGNCSHSPQNSDFLRHSLHEQHQHSASQCLSSIQQFSNPSLTSTKSHSMFSQNGGQTLHSFNQNNHAFSSNLISYNQHLTQSHTLHQFNMSMGNGMISQQDLSEFSSPTRSPKPITDDSLKSDDSSVCSLYANTSIPPIPPSPIPSSLPPALPPKKTKIKQTPNHSPAKPPLSPKPGSVTQIGTASPTTPGTLTCGTPLSGRTSISPAPQFQFDPPSICVYSSMNPEEEVWQKTTPSNKLGKFPVEEIDLEHRKSTNSSPSIRDVDSSLETKSDSEPDIMLEMDVTSRLVWKTPGEDGPDIRGGNPEALIVQSIKPNKDFSYQEAFLTTYRTFVTPIDLIKKLNKRHIFLVRHGQYTKAREVQSLLTRVVGDLTVTDLDDEMLNLVRQFVYGLVSSGDLAMAKALRIVILDKYNSKQLMLQQQQLASGCPWAANVSARRDSILEYKAETIAEQMSLLDADLFTKIPAPEALLWAQDQCEERSPNLTRFTEHFNKMSYWARSRILEQEEAKEREKYVSKFMKVMKYLRKMNNFNSFLALLSALDSAPIRRLDWQKQITDGLKEYGALIDSTLGFRIYRQALAETQPPCIPYIGLVLQDLTFVHIGNNDLLEDGSINFSKRWQQYHILENMKRFSKAQYTFKKNERIIAMFNGFNDILNEEAMWQISESIRPRGGKKNNPS